MTEYYSSELVAYVRAVLEVIPSRATQVAPINSTLKAPGTNLLKLKHDKLLSNVAFNFNLRRYGP